MADYEAWVAGGAAVGESDESDGADWLLDELLTGLRTPDAPTSAARAEYGADAEAAVRRGAADAVAANLATLEGDALALADPDGFLFSNFAVVHLRGR
ncbi:coproporphyrinogen oxidase [Aureococcus anophagefferens]|uniref:Coproporphyrinogen oxidase n=1 Tax=Aureococcus anophagefferens TaxID=44056 RepID=A0ABR1G952_AURAN